ncbi:MAG TPA: circularly permuted type 2 ATP-grasp protein, partial [Candidatus Acidoferrum sp.]|nr:circularly permuted type 2 ATP-grasp protein [Candidatus Acidoferrum sp.]
MDDRLGNIARPIEVSSVESRQTMSDLRATAAAAAMDLFSNYRVPTGAFDECLDSDGKLRPHYEKLRQTLSPLGAAELERRADTSRRLVEEQGITYNVYDDPRGLERPWQLDPFPFVISAAEWRALEAALIQRATLINRILVDCYGPQDLIRSHWLPPALIFAQPDFLRPCHGIRAPGDTFLHFYACDIARSNDGQWWVISDRTQIPTGAGYALANRLVTSRIFPEPF